MSSQEAGFNSRVSSAPNSPSHLQSASVVLGQALGYVTFFRFVRLEQPLPNQPPRMGAEFSGALGSPGGASSGLLHSDFRL